SRNERVEALPEERPRPFDRLEREVGVEPDRLRQVAPSLVEDARDGEQTRRRRPHPDGVRRVVLLEEREDPVQALVDVDLRLAALAAQLRLRELLALERGGEERAVRAAVEVLPRLPGRQGREAPLQVVELRAAARDGGGG